MGPSLYKVAFQISKSRKIEALLKFRIGNETADVQLWSLLQNIKARCENQLIPGTGYAFWLHPVLDIFTSIIVKHSELKISWNRNYWNPESEMKQLKSNNGAHCKTLKSANFRNRNCILITSGTGLSLIVRVGHSTSADYYGGRKSNFGFLFSFFLCSSSLLLDNRYIQY